MPQGVLGQVPARPRLGESWAQWKAFVLNDLLEYKAYAKEVCDFHASEASRLICTAPARGAKSFSAAYDIAPYCLPTRPLVDSRHGIVGVDYSTAKEFDYLWRIFVEERERFAGKLVVESAHNNPRGGDMRIVLNHGRGEDGYEKRCIIQGLSANNEKSLQGEQWTTVALSEAADHEERIFKKYFNPRTWRLYFPTTPKQRAGWLRDLADKGRADPSLGIASFQFPRHANPTYDEANYEQARRLAERSARARIGPHATAEDDPEFAEQFLGRWVYYAGRVLPFERARHVIPAATGRALVPVSDIWVSLDYGFEDPASAGFWAITPDGLYVRFDEIYQRQLSTPRFVEAVQAKLADHGVRRARCTGDPSRPEVSRLFQEAGLPVVVMDKNAQRDRAASKKRLADLLLEGPVERPDRPGSFYPGLYVTDNCTESIRTLESLHYREGHTDENSASALLGEDHVYDDCRYLVMSRPPPKRQPRPDAFEDLRREQARRGVDRKTLLGTRAYRWRSGTGGWPVRAA